MRKVVVITGGGRGIGEAIARSLAAAGAAVVINDNGVELDGLAPDPEVAAAVARSIRSGGGQAIADSGDIGDTDVGERVIASAIAEFGAVDAVVTAAGVLRDRMLFNLSDDDWDLVVRTHLRGAYSAVAPAARYWRTLRNPAANFRIIAMTSVSGLDGSPGQPNYSAAKLGMVGLIYSSARALAGYGVTANAVAPAALTRMTAGLDPRRAAALDVSHIARLVSYLVSDRSRWLTGRVLSAEGPTIGLYANPSVVSQIDGIDGLDDAELADRLEAAFGWAAGLTPSRFDGRTRVGR